MKKLCWIWLDIYSDVQTGSRSSSSDWIQIQIFRPDLRPFPQVVRLLHNQYSINLFEKTAFKKENIFTWLTYGLIYDVLYDRKTRISKKKTVNGNW